MENLIYFMHIAKAAGSTINNIISTQYEPENLITHFESTLLENVDKLKNKKFISGHPFYHIAHKVIPSFDQYFKIAVFRKPINQLMSHIAWVRRLAEPQEIKRFKSHPKHFQDMALRLKNIDLSDHVALSSFVKNLNQHELVTFDNFQTRYLCPKQPNTKIDQNDFANAKSMLNEFDLIGTVENLNGFLMQLHNTMGWELPSEFISKNISKGYFGLNLKDEIQQKALYPLIHYDNKLYDIVCTINNNSKTKI